MQKKVTVFFCWSVRLLTSLSVPSCLHFLTSLSSHTICMYCSRPSATSSCGQISLPGFLQPACHLLVCFQSDLLAERCTLHYIPTGGVQVLWKTCWENEERSWSLSKQAHPLTSCAMMRSHQIEGETFLTFLIKRCAGIGLSSPKYGLLERI